MTRRRWITWLVFALCALLVIDVLGWATWRVLKLERAERLATAQADAGRRERLALWQMDSLVSAIIARESARPYFVYRPVYAADMPYEAAWETEASDAVRPSPLAAGTGDPLIRLHYQSGEGGTISPQAAPFGVMAGGAPEDAAPDPRTLRAGRLVRELDSIRREGDHRAENARIATAISRRPETESSPGPAGSRGAEKSRTADAGEQAFDAALSQAPISTPAEADSDADQTASVDEQSEPDDSRLRRQLFDIARNNLERPRSQDQAARVEIGVFRPRWLVGPAAPSSGEQPEPELVFERTIQINGQNLTQGFWIDWPALRAELLAVAVRMVPGAMLNRAPADAGPATNALATIPVRLDSPDPTSDLAGSTPTRVTLAVTWAATITALAAIGLVLRAATRLADRRGRFVAAVTHELRSPLTSFRLYTDLLARGTDDPGARTNYVDALRRESARLGSVVENVLTYAGLATRQAEARPESVSKVLDAMTPSLHERAHESDANLTVRVSSDAGRACIKVSPGSVERVLTNLVDNACRYGLTEAERTVTLSAELTQGSVRIRVADRGRGISPADRARLFTEFTRGSAVNDDRGVGLGLALARGLARSEGGDLRLLRHDGSGAVFELRLPTCPLPVDEQ